MREDRRKARRFPVLGEQQQATLRVGDATFPARLIDQSATGFAIRMEEHPGVFPGEVVWLQTVAGWTEVRVVKARHEVDGTQIGLERIADLAAGPKPAASILADQLAQQDPRANVWPLFGLSVALLAVLCFLAWTAIGRHVANLAAVPEPPQQTADPRPAAVRAIEREASRRASELHRSIQHYGAVMLTLPEVMEQLQFSPQQRQRLQEIVRSVMKQEDELLKTAPVGDHEVEAKIQRLRQTASEEAMKVLDTQQRKQWDAMFSAAMQRLLPGRKPDKPD
jgi:hypothetical protein